LAVFETGADFEVVESMADGQFLRFPFYTVYLILDSEGSYWNLLLLSIPFHFGAMHCPGIRQAFTIHISLLLWRMT
jgi:hypothetical protein